MDSIISFLTSKEIIFVYILAGIACAICLIVYLVEKNNEKIRKKHNTRELNKLVEEIVEELDAEEERINYITPVIQSSELIEDTALSKNVSIEVKEDNSLQSEVIETKKEEVEIEELDEVEELEYTAIEPDQETAKLELKKLEQELLRQEKLKEEQERLEQARLEQTRLEKEAIEAERIRQEQEAKAQQIINEQIDAEVNQNIELTDFEKEQEKTAIISLDELFQKSKEMYAQNELTQYKDEGNEPISLQDLERMFEGSSNNIEEPVIIANVLEDTSSNDIKVEVVDQKVMDKLKLEDYKAILEDKPEEVKYPAQHETKFRSSPIISPIFGIERDSDRNLELENTANYDKLDAQIKNSSNFIVSLKELQENLD